jgi:hypothetical protein
MQISLEFITEDIVKGYLSGHATETAKEELKVENDNN